MAPKSRRVLFIVLGSCLAFLILVIVLVSVAGGGKDTSTAVAKTPTTSTPSKAPKVATIPKSVSYTGHATAAQRNGFLSIVRDAYPALVNESDSDLFTQADATCKALKAGATGVQIQAQMLKVANGNNQVASALGYVTGASVGTFCPEYTAQVKLGVTN